jgi:hypothetical protein
MLRHVLSRSAFTRADKVGPANRGLTPGCRLSPHPRASRWHHPAPSPHYAKACPAGLSALSRTMTHPRGPNIAVPCQGWGRGFESLRPLQFKQTIRTAGDRRARAKEGGAPGDGKRAAVNAATNRAVARPSETRLSLSAIGGATFIPKGTPFPKAPHPTRDGRSCPLTR